MKSPFKSRPKPKKKETEEQESTFWISRGKIEHIPGFCPLCSEPVDITVKESPVELLGICSRCSQILFYLDKLRTPQDPKGLEEFGKFLSWFIHD